MLTFRLDANGSQQVRWPKNDAEIVRLGRAYVESQTKLSDENRFPKFDLITKQLELTQEAMSSAENQEAGRSAVSSVEADSFEKAKNTVRTIVAGLTYNHINELLVLEQWGISMVNRKAGAKAQTPQSKEGVLKLLSSYIQMEESLVEEKRLPKPPLSEVKDVKEALKTSLSSKQVLLARRKQSVIERLAEAQRLLDMLQMAAAYHLVIDFGGVVDGRLQEFGFDVVAVSAPAPAAAIPSTPASS